MNVRLDDIDACFQGAIPSVLASTSRAGVPNVTHISIVHRIGDTHVGLSRQFFNKTIRNLLENPRAQALVTEPNSGRIFQLNLLYEHTETEGPLFERMSARLDAIAWAEGMAAVFKLAAVDVCRVLSCQKLASDWDSAPVRQTESSIDTLDVFSLRIAECSDLETLTQVALDSCEEIFACNHSILLLVDESGERLYTVASRGYRNSGVGAEVPFGQGIIGVAAQRRQPVRIGNMASELAYLHAAQSSAQRAGVRDVSHEEIELPGLENTLSQLAVPILARGELMGVLCVQSELPGRFGTRDEMLLNVAARQLGLALQVVRASRDHEPMIVAQIDKPRARVATPAQVKYYAADDSVFIDNEYVIKGVAGRILWRLLRIYNEERRVEFTNKEIRLDPLLDLPDIKDNLEARLILLRKRLEERCDFLRINHTGRGRFRLVADREVDLREVE